MKKIKVGGITILKVKGRGKSAPPKIHASKGTEMYTQNLVINTNLQVIVDDYKENDAIEIIRANSKMGKIFIWPIARAIDIESGAENEQAI